MFVVQISLLIVTFLSLTSQIFSLMQASKENNPYPRITPCVNKWSVFFLILILILFIMPLVECWCMHMPHCPGRPSGVGHTNEDERSMNSNFIVSHATLISIVSLVHVNTTKCGNITCTLVATCVILRSLECRCRGV